MLDKVNSNIYANFLPKSQPPAAVGLYPYPQYQYPNDRYVNKQPHKKETKLYKFLKYTALTAGLAVGAAVTAFAFNDNFRRKVIFNPQTKKFLKIPTELQNKFKDQSIEKIALYSANCELDGWYKKATAGKPTVILCVGRGTTINQFADDALKFFKNPKLKDHGLLMFDNRGFGNSQGIPSTEAMYEDLKEAVKFVKDRGKQNGQVINNKDIILMGRSLGTYPVAKLASESNNAPFKKVVFSSMFASPRNILNTLLSKTGLDKLGVSFPKSLFPKNFLKTGRCFKQIDPNKQNILVIHSTKDDLTTIKKVEEKLVGKSKAKFNINPMDNKKIQLVKDDFGPHKSSKKQLNRMMDIAWDKIVED